MNVEAGYYNLRCVTTNNGETEAQYYNDVYIANYTEYKKIRAKWIAKLAEYGYTVNSEVTYKLCKEQHRVSFDWDLE